MGKGVYRPLPRSAISQDGGVKMRARDQRAFCIKRPDGALLITTMERSHSKCWREFVYTSNAPVDRAEYERQGYLCVKVTIMEQPHD